VNVALGVSVAIHETLAGDAWPGPDGIVGTSDDENNWGATTLRALNSAEQWALATDALERIIAAGIEPPVGSRLRFNNFRYRWIPTVPGVDVVAMQKALGFRGADVDGKLGPKTMAAFTAWAADTPGLTPEDVWPKELGAAPISAAEALAVRPITPSVSNGHAARATEAMAVLRRAFAPGTLPPAVIHCDSTPEDGQYFVWFAAFVSEKAGAMYFQTLLNKFGRAVLEAGGSPTDLARAMYGRKYGYYTGFFERDRVYEDGRTGAEKNIAAYAARISAPYPAVYAAAA
jgi:hypothetical protein